MNDTWFRLALLGLVMTVVAGCSKPETPQEVAAEFWQAMAENDADAVADLSTLARPSDFDGYARDWLNTVPDFGRVIIDDHEATIVTRLPSENGASGQRREIVTYLLELNGDWLVDYDRTGKAITDPSPLDGLMGEINRLGERLSATFSRSSDDLAIRMDAMAREFEAYSGEASRRARQAMEDYSQALQDFMEELEQSIEEALEDNQQAPARDRSALQQTATDLNQSSDRLDKPDFDALADSSRALAEAGARFSTLSDEAFESYRREWDARLGEISERTLAFFEELEDSRR
ncbi:hypothetical protein DIT72_02865 [Marinobacter orientalis]|uniref:Uncharacterized protein n=2 Tax=Marinobacter orientalis TaxID=1928859 RepID=A0A7Y0RB44_9GAMM|nr:hypothetical protein [Marinobacter orientalis]TGX50993.1 hypothetical protein DIT72_02865 [Marinobacter orientalis]